MEALPHSHPPSSKVSVSQLSVCNGLTDGQTSLDKVSLQLANIGPEYVIWDNEGADTSTITPMTLDGEICTAPAEGMV